jgi:hypothetical protein
MDYLLISRAHLRLLEDVAVQRRVITIANTLLKLLSDASGSNDVDGRSSSVVQQAMAQADIFKFTHPAAESGISSRVEYFIELITKDFRSLPNPKEQHNRLLVAMGQMVPITPDQLFLAVLFGHLKNVIAAHTTNRSSKLRIWLGDTHLSAAVARGGHLSVLQQLREWGYSWNEKTLRHAINNGHADVAIWTLQHGVPIKFYSWWLGAAYVWNGACWPVLEWAWQHGHLSEGQLDEIRVEATTRPGRSEPILALLEHMLRGEPGQAGERHA